MAAVKYTVANSIIIKIANKPKTNEIISVLFLFFKLNPIKIGKTGKIQGDKIEILCNKRNKQKNFHNLSPHIIFIKPLAHNILQ